MFNQVKKTILPQSDDREEVAYLKKKISELELRIERLEENNKHNVTWNDLWIAFVVAVVAGIFI